MECKQKMEISRTLKKCTCLLSQCSGNRQHRNTLNSNTLFKKCSDFYLFDQIIFGFCICSYLNDSLLILLLFLRLSLWWRKENTKVLLKSENPSQWRSIRILLAITKCTDDNINELWKESRFLKSQDTDVFPVCFSQEKCSSCQDWTKKDDRPSKKSEWITISDKLGLISSSSSWYLQL